MMYVMCVMYMIGKPVDYRVGRNCCDMYTDVDVRSSNGEEAEVICYFILLCHVYHKHHKHHSSTIECCGGLTVYLCN